MFNWVVIGDGCTPQNMLHALDYTENVIYVDTGQKGEEQVGTSCSRDLNVPICSHTLKRINVFVLLGNLPVERAKNAVCFLQWCGVSLVSSYAVCFLQRGGMSLASSTIIYNIVKVKVTLIDTC